MLQGPQKILLIDDDPAFCRLAGKSVQRNGYAVEYAHDCATGIARAREFDLIILDHHLPDRDGLSALADLNRLPDAPPVIYLTASEDRGIAVSALKAGASDYVVKDVHGDFLMLLDASIKSALLARFLRRAKEAAEAEILKARDDYKALADERALLLKEMNHRVGNSLQLIASLLHMQTRVTQKSEVKDALLEANRRVMAVAQVHRSLYSSDNVQSISLKEYLRALTADISNASGDEHKGIEVTLLAEDISAEPDRAVALGIVVTELVLNAMKHAYPGGKGAVRVSLSAVNGAEAELMVSDDGVGVLDGAPPSGTGLGRTIMKAMAQKLGADMTYEKPETGTRAVLKFKRTLPHQ